MDMVKLRNGTEEAAPLVSVVKLGIRRLQEKRPITLYELVMKCRDRDHTFSGGCEDELISLGLVERGGHIHESIRNVVLSSATGDGLEMTFVDPAKPSDA